MSQNFPQGLGQGLQGPPGPTSTLSPWGMMDDDAGDSNKRTILKWEQEEEMGDLATISCVLYVNMCHPDLKQKYPGTFPGHFVSFLEYFYYSPLSFWFLLLLILVFFPFEDNTYTLLYFRLHLRHFLSWSLLSALVLWLLLCISCLSGYFYFPQVFRLFLFCTPVL